MKKSLLLLLVMPIIAIGQVKSKPVVLNYKYFASQELGYVLDISSTIVIGPNAMIYFHTNFENDPVDFEMEVTAYKEDGSNLIIEGDSLVSDQKILFVFNKETEFVWLSFGDYWYVFKN